jgi:anti-sigma-K factor RskA
MSKRASRIRWRWVSISIGIGTIVAMVIATTINGWRRQALDLWCVQVEPNGSEKTLYGEDCNFPK